MHDDNFGPNLCLPRHYLKQKHFRMLFGASLHKPALDALDAEAVGLDMLTLFASKLSNPSIPWLGRFRAFARSRLLVLRTLRISRVAYLAHLEGLRDRQGGLIEPEGSKKWGAFLPEHFYMVEVSAPELFPASRRKFGEILLRSDVAVDASDPSHNFLFVRLPGIFGYLSGTQIMTEPSPIQGHTPLYQAS